MLSLSFNPDHLSEDLSNNRHNRSTAAYYLLLKGALRDQ